jgi:hypothetical protein
MKLVEGWFHTCKILLSRFHYVCGGSAPWRADWKKPATAEFARLKADDVEFMEEIKEMIAQNGTEGILLRSSFSKANVDDPRTESFAATLRLNHWYECGLYWTHQLFLENWDTGTPHIMPEKPCWTLRQQFEKNEVLRRMLNPPL